MCSESVLPKEFQKTTEVLPFNRFGLSSLEELQNAEKDIQHQEWLKKAGLSTSEISLYQDNERGNLDHHKNIEAGALKEKLRHIYEKINKLKKADESHEQEPTSSNTTDTLETPQDSPSTYAEGHPMNNIKELEDNLFGHLHQDILPITKRLKILRHLERRKERILSREKQLMSKTVISAPVKPGSLWDVKELPEKVKHDVKQNTKELHESPSTSNQEEKIIGPKEPTMYTIKENKIVRLEPVNDQNDNENGDENDDENDDDDEENDDEYRAVDIVVPINAAEETLLEGTKMSVDDIMKIERFRNYEPGVPSKVLYLKNIAPSVSQEQISLLFNQFLLDNGGPIDVRLMTGRMRGQAFVSFTNEDIAIQALEEVNGTILSGQPVIAEFGRNTNRIQDEDIR